MLPNSHTDPDPRALRVAQKLHAEHQPLATVLYGSRATGAHHPTSDIDILMITENPEFPPPGLNKRALELALQEYGKPLEVQIKMTEDEDALEEEGLADSITGQALMKGIVISDWPRIYHSRFRGDDPAPTRLCWQKYKAHQYMAKSFLKPVQRIADDLKTGTTSDPSGDTYSEYLASSTSEKIAQDIWRNGQTALHHILRATVEAQGERTRETDTPTHLAERLAAMAPDEDTATLITPQDYGADTAPGGMTTLELATAVSRDIEHLRRLASRLQRQLQTRMKKDIDPRRETHETMVRMVRSGIRSMARSMPDYVDTGDPPPGEIITTTNEFGKISLTAKFALNPRASHWKRRDNRARANPQARDIQLTVTPTWTATAGYTDPDTGDLVAIELDEQEQRAVDAFASKEADYFITADSTLWPENQPYNHGTEPDSLEELTQYSRENLETMLEESQQEVNLIQEALRRTTTGTLPNGATASSAAIKPTRTTMPPST